MTHLPEDDRDLVEFLRQHRPTPPAAPPGLEDQILAQIAQEPARGASPAKVVPLRGRSRQVWIPAAIAAGLVASVAGYRLLNPLTPSGSEMATMQAFLENNWHDAVNDTDGDLISLVDSPSE